MAYQKIEEIKKIDFQNIELKDTGIAKQR